MPLTHKPTPQQLEELQQASIRASEAHAELTRASAAHMEAVTSLNAATMIVLYGPLDEGEHGPELPQNAPKGSAYDLSNEAARAAWPSRRPAPGG